MNIKDFEEYCALENAPDVLKLIRIKVREDKNRAKWMIDYYFRNHDFDLSKFPGAYRDLCRILIEEYL